MGIGMRRDLESVPAANRDSNSYKQPFLASSKSHDRIDATPERTEAISLRERIWESV